ncbi:MAG: SemiSWEET transporter [Deltaproteobacteria bacterium]|nr:SemiSWEET transporter [Deltaproteobacteria bacterium]
MDSVTILGLVAGFLTTSAFLPQVIKIWKSKSSKDISFVTFLTLFLGAVSWLIYGVLIRAWPVILANGLTMVLVATIIVLKIRYERYDKARSQEP